MPRKTIPISTRITPEDAEFIAGWTDDEAKTPSEKLRAIIAVARRRQRGTQEYASSLRFAEELMAPTLTILRTSEHATSLHSELVTRLAEWLPECFAYFVSCNGDDTQLDEDALRRIEKGLADRVVTLMQSTLQMAVTRKSPCYEPTLIRERVRPVLDLADVISRQ